MSEQPQYQAGYKLRDLKAFIEERVGDKVAKRMSAEMVDIELLVGVKNQGHGYDMFNQLYEAEFYFERFPFKDYDPAVLFANVLAWLMDNDKERVDNDVPEPDVTVTVTGDNDAILVVTVPFEEPVKVVEDPEGPIYWKGKQYSIEQYEIWTATKLRDVVIE